MFFFNHEPSKHIALHQIHKIMLFLATSYDPFKDVALLVPFATLLIQFIF